MIQQDARLGRMLLLRILEQLGWQELPDHQRMKGFSFYSNLRASIGRIEAAFLEGKIENARFNATAAANEIIALLRSNTKGKPTASLIKRDAGHDATVPSNAPLKAGASISHAI